MKAWHVFSPKTTYSVTVRTWCRVHDTQCIQLSNSVSLSSLPVAFQHFREHMPFNGFLRQRAHPIVASFNYHKVLLYGLVSTIAVSATISNALRYHSNFYSVAIYLSKSNRSVLVRDALIVIHGILKQLSDTCKFRPSDCITVWAARATDILRRPSSSGGGGNSHWVDGRPCA